MDLAACDGIGQRQDGLITRRQALRVLTDNQIESLLARQIWFELYPSVYRMAGAAKTWHRRALGATLSNRDRLAVSHCSAAFLWGMLERQPPDVEVLTCMSRSARLPGVSVHRTRIWHEHMESVVRGVRVTRPARTLVDLASSKRTAGLVRTALDNAITLRILRIDELSAELDRIGPRKRSHCKALESVLQHRDASYEKTSSRGDINVLDWIMTAGLPRPVPQFRIPIGTDDTFVPDFAYPEWRIAIEVQSWRWHASPSRYERDAHKSILLAAMGWIVLPVLPRTDNQTPFTQALTNLIASRRLDPPA